MCLGFLDHRVRHLSKAPLVVCSFDHMRRAGWSNNVFFIRNVTMRLCGLYRRAACHCRRQFSHHLLRSRPLKYDSHILCGAFDFVRFGFLRLQHLINLVFSSMAIHCQPSIGSGSYDFKFMWVYLRCVLLVLPCDSRTRHWPYLTVRFLAAEDSLCSSSWW